MKVRLWDYQTLNKIPMRIPVKFRRKHGKDVCGMGQVVLFKGTITRKGVKGLSLIDIDM